MFWRRDLVIFANRPSAEYRMKKQSEQYGNIEIPQREWPRFLESFAVQHEGWLGSLSVSRDPQAPILISPCTLQGIAMNGKGNGRRIDIKCLQNGKPRTYYVADPLRVVFQQESNGAHRGLEIQSRDGSTTNFQFRAAALPETLDGVLPDLNAER